MVVELCVAFGAGWLLARADDIIAGLKERQGHRERMLLFDKALSGGNPVDLYNLRVADEVSQRKDTIDTAAFKEKVRAAPEEDVAAEPWANDPIYGRCDVQLDLQAGVFHIFDPDAMDGPDTWTEPIDEFMGRFEQPADSTV